MNFIEFKRKGDYILLSICNKLWYYRNYKVNYFNRRSNAKKKTDEFSYIFYWNIYLSG